MLRAATGLSRIGIGATIYPMPDVDGVFSEAMKLSEDERVQLVQRLEVGLHGLDEQVDDAWRAEVARRRALLTSGQSAAEPWEAVKSELARL